LTISIERDTLSIVRRFVLIVATGLGTGYIPGIPGTAGSLLGVALFLLLSFLPYWLYAVTLIGLLFLSVWASDKAEDIFEERDCQKIVIDEVFGILVTLAFLPPTTKNLIVGFLLFRLLDSLKPPPAYQFNRGTYGGWGVVLDDLAAGLYSGILMRII